MNLEGVEQIANAVLYEGYNLYPYRPSSVKNRQRWTFGGVCPRAYCLAQGGEAWSVETQCLAQGDERTTVSVKVRFLHLIRRHVGALMVGSSSQIEPAGARDPGGSQNQRAPHPPEADLLGPSPLQEQEGTGLSPSLPQDWGSEGRGERGPALAQSATRYVDALQVGDRLIQAWDEAAERDVEAGGLALGELARRPHRLAFAFPAWQGLEPLHNEGGEAAGVLEREQRPIEGALTIEVEPIGDPRLFKITARVMNLTPCSARSRDEAMLQSFASTHLILGLNGGEFVSAIDPPESLRESVAGCRNQGVWPVLVGEAPARDTMLASPLILYDYPELASESPGELFDGTEIDEILTLRIMTLTEDERRAMRGTDERTRALLERTDALAAEQLATLHGAMRGLRSQG